jgi:hypothetical protein
VACVLTEDLAGFYGALQLERLPPLRKNTPLPLSTGAITRGPLIAPLPLETAMLVPPTFGQVQKARLVALPEDQRLCTPTLDADRSSCTTTPNRGPG